MPPQLLDDLLIIFAMQIARIQEKLYPHYTVHNPGPRRPDLADQETSKPSRLV